MEKETLMAKFNKAPALIQFIIWFIFCYTVFFIAWSLVEMRTQMLNKLDSDLTSTIISVILALMFTIMQHQMKKSKRFWETLREIETEVTNSTTADELKSLRKRLRTLANTEVYHIMIMECNKVFTIIDTRLRYEFKESE